MLAALVGDGLLGEGGAVVGVVLLEPAAQLEPKERYLSGNRLMFAFSGRLFPCAPT
jgi:hypothetical protein